MIKSIAVIGLGIIGGSIAKAVKKNSALRVTVFNRSPQTAGEAIACGAADEIWDGKSPLNADLTVIALPPAATVAFLRENAGKLRAGSVVTDVCGVKGFITEECGAICAAHGLLFIGGHPMAGREKGGFANSDGDLFKGASYIVTPTGETDKKAVEAMETFAKILGVGGLTVTSPAHHDEIIAFTSQLPHVLAGAYVKSPSCAGRKGYSAGSFADVSRVATADEDLWSELFTLNKDNLVREIETLSENLLEYRDALASGDTERLSALIKHGRLIKEKDLT